MEGRRRPVLGFVTGISYQSGLDYYKCVNEQCMALTPHGVHMPHNPLMVMCSLDCDPYAALLVQKQWDATVEYLLGGVRRVAQAGADVLILCSNTAHIAAPAARSLFPNLPLLHIADTTARAVLEKGLTTVGLLGTAPTMQESYLKLQLAKHGISTLVPEREEDLRQIFQYIMDELGQGKFLEPTRAFFVAQARALAARGAGGVIMGCTEIELLMRQEDCPELPLFGSAALHIAAAARVGSGLATVEEYMPPADRAVYACPSAAAAQPPVFSAADVRRRLPTERCLAAAERALRAVSAGEGRMPVRLVTPLPATDGGFAALAAMPCYLGGLCACKAITVFPANAGTAYSSHQGAVLLFDGTVNGALRCICDAHELTLLRTAAASAVATRALSRDVPSVLTLMGTGQQALAHVEAIRLVRRITAVRVWGRRLEAAQRVAALIAGSGLEAAAVESAAEAVRGADIVCTLTPAAEPILKGEWLKAGAHVNAVGACTPRHRELDAEAVRRAVVFADTREACLSEAGDIVAPIREGHITAEHVVGEVGAVLNGALQGRRGEADVTLFESLGCALEDLCAAEAVWEAGAGTP